MRPACIIVATPIGNLKDISLRALGTLAGADAILAEDTRVTKTLLAHYGIEAPMIAYHEHNAERARPQIIERLSKGEALALVSDAGTPLVSDPGYRLAVEAIAAGAAVTAIPGASAVLAAMAVAGLPTDRFFFEGFLPPKSAARRARLRELEGIPGTLVFFESPSRVAAMIGDAAAMLGPRQATIARELTKLHEEAIRGSLVELADRLREWRRLRGEIVVLIAPPGADEPASAAPGEIWMISCAALVRLSLKQAVADVTATTGQPRHAHSSKMRGRVARLSGRYRLKRRRSTRDRATRAAAGACGGVRGCALAHGQGLPNPRAPLFGAGGEIDLIARRGRTVAFIEVKAAIRWRRSGCDLLRQGGAARAADASARPQSLGCGSHPARGCDSPEPSVGPAMLRMHFSSRATSSDDGLRSGQLPPGPDHRLHRRAVRAIRRLDASRGPTMTLSVADGPHPEHPHSQAIRPLRFCSKRRREGTRFPTIRPDRLSMRDGKPSAVMQPLTVSDQEGDHYALGPAERRDLARSTSSTCGRTRRLI